MPSKKPKRAPKRSKKKGKATEISVEKKKPDHPDDIFPLALTSGTQELFHCSADDDVTGENTHKLLDKNDILEDTEARGALSEFSPVKQILLNYPENEILLVFDKDFTYGHSFYLVLTLEAKNRIIPPKPETAELPTEVFLEEEPKTWISLGSEHEINEEYISNARGKLWYKFSRLRRKFGAAVCFSDHSGKDVRDGYLETVPEEESQLSIKQMQRDCGTQTAVIHQSSSTQTLWKKMRNNITQYIPRELEDNETDNILQSESLKEFYNLVTPQVLQALQQEEIMNVFIDDWEALGTKAEDWSEKVSEGLTLCQAFMIQKCNATVSCINWHPTIYGVIAVALIRKNKWSNESSRLDRPLILFYSFSDPLSPQLVLECPDNILAFEFCPSAPNIIVGGSENGQVVLWDISAHVKHLKGTCLTNDMLELSDDEKNTIPDMYFCAVSSVESGHKGPITDVHWLPATLEGNSQPLPIKSNFLGQFVTCSPDCSLLLWDIQISKSESESVDQIPHMTTCGVPNTFKHLDRTWKPLFGVSLSKIIGSGEYAPLRFSLAHCMDSGNTKICIGTEDGEVVSTDWKMEEDNSGQLYSAKPLHCFSTHNGSVSTVQRSPFFKDIILTGTSQSGSCNFAIWKEGIMDGPIVLSSSCELHGTAGCWSMSRPAVFFIGKEDGSVEVWNLLEKTNEPAQVYTHISNAKITCIKDWTVFSKQHFLAIGDDLGRVHVFEISKELSTSFRNENSKVKELLNREETRMMDFLKWRNHVSGKQREKADDLVKKTEPMETLEEESLKEYTNFSLREKSILKNLGLLPAIDDTQDT
ncbi:dynein axonemal intermediate chain 3-like [Aulostomus maculatus]